MQIRLMIEDDAGSITEVLNHSIGHSVAHFGTVPTSADEVLGDWHATGELYPWIVATDDAGAFMGFAKGSAWKTRQAYRWTVESGIYLTKGAQGMGAGKALYTKLFEILTLQGYRTVVSGVSVPNPASERLHESFGMKTIGDISPAGFKLGKWVDVRLYQKNLSELDATSAPGPIRAVSSVWDELGVHSADTQEQSE